METEQPTKPATELVLGRVAHYFEAGSGACQAAIVVDAFEGDEIANLIVWTHGGAQSTRTSVVWEARPDRSQTASSFHLARQCPWDR